MALLNFLTVESSPLLKNSKFLQRELFQSGGDSETLGTTEEVLFKDYLKQQIDHLMTGDAGRDGVAEGRRGTHVEVRTGFSRFPRLKLIIRQTVETHEIGHNKMSVTVPYESFRLFHSECTT